MFVSVTVCVWKAQNQWLIFRVFIFCWITKTIIFSYRYFGISHSLIRHLSDFLDILFRFRNHKSFCTVIFRMIARSWRHNEALVSKNSCDSLLWQFGFGCTDKLIKYFFDEGFSLVPLISG